ncbi:hypothetical protein [uncultured Methylobacterium sp.]|uniref:hypothetical protein n=1 Tax=uncultured Methylobacterium sp. TaxID=157278 RepID=UPI0035CC72E9
MTDQDVLRQDLSDLMEVAGMEDFARPISPHQVFQEALGKIRDKMDSPRHAGRVQALGAAISRREWGEVEAAYAAIRDAKERP